jgi:hypothetical protein
VDSLETVIDRVGPLDLGDPHADPLVGYILEKYETIQERARIMFQALEVLYREGILDEPGIRAIRRQREHDASQLIQRYRSLLGEYKRRGDGPDPEDMARKRRVADILVLKVDHLERTYLREKQRLKISTDLAAMREEIEHLQGIASEYRGSAVAYGAEERLLVLRGREEILGRELQRVEREQEALLCEFSIQAGEYLLATLELKEDRTQLARQINVQQKRLGQLRDQLQSMPPREDTRRYSRKSISR